MRLSRNERCARHHESEPRRPLGEVGYLTVGVPDAGRAMAFYGSLLGWRFEDPPGPDYHHVAGSSPAIGLVGGADEPQVAWFVRTDDIRALLTLPAAPRTHRAGVTSDRHGIKVKANLSGWHPTLFSFDT